MKMENPTNTFRQTLCFSSYKNRELKLKLWLVGVRGKERVHFCIFCPKDIFSTFVLYLNVQCTEETFRIHTVLRIKKIYFIHFFCLFLKLSKALSMLESLLAGANTFLKNFWISAKMCFLLLILFTIKVYAQINIFCVFFLKLSKAFSLKLCNIH